MMLRSLLIFVVMALGTAAQATETLRMLGRYAADPQLSFTWYDAAVMSKKIRQIAAQEEELRAQERPQAIAGSRFSSVREEDLL